MDDPDTLRKAFEGSAGVFSVQNGYENGFERETTQGRNVAEAAQASGMRHLVYSSAGTGRAGTGVPSWESKIPIEERIRELGVPATILRPLAFMELMNDPAFYPAVGTWRIFPRLTGEDRPIPWLSVDDLGQIVAAVFEKPVDYVGRELTLTSDSRTLAECRSLYREIMGKAPRTFPMPLWLFDRFTHKDATTMWRWLRTGEVDQDAQATRTLLPSAQTVPEWMRRVQMDSGIASQ
jgi:uncharacterized protein YbjT (DUF2867 family)